MFMALLDSTIVNVGGDPDTGRIKVQGQHPAGGRAGIVDRHRGRLAWRVIRERPGVPRREGAAAIARDPDVRRGRDRGRDRPPRSLRAGARETVRCRMETTRRVGGGQC